MNPFKFGDPVEGEFYLPRPELDKLVYQFVSNRIHVVLIGPRRFGKTSFVFNLLKNLEKEGYSCLFIDIYCSELNMRKMLMMIGKMINMRC